MLKLPKPNANLELKFSFDGNISSFLGVPFEGSKVEATGTEEINIFGLSVFDVSVSEIMIFDLIFSVLETFGLNDFLSYKLMRQQQKCYLLKCYRQI